MRRHSWRNVTLADTDGIAQRCVHCDTERVRDESTKTLYAFRGGRGLVNRRPLKADKWEFFVAGVAPECVER
jgi:hypothetical protein